MTRVEGLEINDVALGGKGVGRHEGKAVFIPFVIDGETVSARIIRERKKFNEAELENVDTSSPHRVAPPCPYFGRCGGCTYQHITYEHQLAIKSRQVEQTMARLGGLSKVPMRPIIPSAAAYGYRNRITVHVDDGIIGFYQRDSHQLLDIEQCPISSAKVNAKLAQFRAGRPRDGHYTLRAQDGPGVFTQTNDEVAHALQDLVERLLRSCSGKLIDAYCGTGLFAKRLRSQFAQIIGIDWDQRAIARAQGDARPNEKYIAGDVGLELRHSLEGAEVLIVDPPAEGLSGPARDAISKSPPSRVIYVSCDPATLARDLHELQESLVVNSVTPLDMFPQTAEIEVVVKLTRRAA